MALPAGLIKPSPPLPISSVGLRSPALLPGEHGRAAGPIRNRQMLERSLDLLAALPMGAGLLVIAFPGSRGTASLLDQAHRLSRRSVIPIEVIQIPEAA